MSAHDIASAIVESLRIAGFAARVGLVDVGEYAVTIDHVRLAFVTSDRVVWNARLEGSRWQEEA